MKKTLAILAATVATLGLANAAEARGGSGISFSYGWSSPSYYSQPAYYPQPVYYQPAPVYYAPQPVYYNPSPYYTPSYSSFSLGFGNRWGGGHHRGHHRGGWGGHHRGWH